ncbi:hypothetical protein [Nocardia vermiculata]|uniref:DUF8176 domain-containing protein n=1 Tax=Nocardia vermiculata TaxID=257274 RepID=A0A846Y2D5_9NOCA|nr:hypothetical protein [Nocardia vermiculata]NKY52162.1 hypothetical protein [Nocardia vermiculata]
MGSDTGRHPTGSEFDRGPGVAAPQPFGPPVGPPSHLPVGHGPARPGGPGWAIDPDAIQRTLGTATRRTVAPRSGTRRRWMTVLFAVLVAGSAGAGITVAVTAGSRGEPGTAIAAATTVSSGAVSPGTPEPPGVPVVPVPGHSPSDVSCEPAAGDVIVGNGPGGTDTGPNAVLGFEYAYYTERDGLRAQEFVAPDTVNVAGARGLQQAIDTVIPPGTTHCVHIRPAGPELFEVDIDEYRPGGQHLTYRQTVRTVVRDGRTLLYEIGDRG